MARVAESAPSIVKPVSPDPFSTVVASSILTGLKIQHKRVIRSEPDSILYLNHHHEARTLWLDRGETGAVIWHQVDFGFAVRRPEHLIIT